MGLDTSNRKRARVPPQPRVVIAIDLNAFYASALLQLPEYRHLSSRPVGVVQKHLIVTTNYIARSQGVKKMSLARDAQRMHPNLALIDGSDLAPFRKAARKVRDAVRHCVDSNVTPIEYLGLDEVFLDVSEEVNCRIRGQYESKRVVHGSLGHVPSGSAVGFMGHVVGEIGRDDREENDSDLYQYRALQVGSHLAGEIRSYVAEQTQFLTCAGVAENKLGAKIAAGMHKPNDQTTFVSCAAIRDYLAGRSPQTIPGFGRGYGIRLGQWAEEREKKEGARPAVETVGNLRTTFALPGMRGELARALSCSENVASWILGACEGRDMSPVKQSGAPRVVNCEDSMQNCADVADLRRRLSQLCIELVGRLIDDAEEFGNRYPATLTVHFRFKGMGYKSCSRASSMPASVHAPGLRGTRSKNAIDIAVRDILERALSILRRQGVSKASQFSLTLLGVGASRFAGSAHQLPMSQTIQPFLSAKKSLRSFPKVASGGLRLASRVGSPAAQADRENQILDETAVFCPVCCTVLPRGASNAAINAHVDGCVVSEPKTREISTTKLNTRRVDSFFK